MTRKSSAAIGDTFTTNDGVCKIVDIVNMKRVTVQFLKTGSLKVCTAHDLRRGLVKDPSLPTVFGFGVNDSDYVVSGRVDGEWFVCPFYEKWRSMIKRCYSHVNHKKSPTYKDVAVCDDWRYFSKFKKWMELQYWEGRELDKDWLGDGLLYSPDTCSFVPKEVNYFISHKHNNLPLGVSYDHARNKFMASNNGRQKRFDDVYDAHRFWRFGRIDALKKFLDLHIDTRVKCRMEQIIEQYQEDDKNGAISSIESCGKGTNK